MSAGKTVSFRFWLPAGSCIKAIQPYVQQGAAASWQFTASYVPVTSMTANDWNTVTVQVPAGAVVPLAKLGIELITDAA